MTLAEARQTKAYWLWLIAVLFGAMLISGIITYAPSYWQGNGMDQLQTSNYISLFSLLGATIMLFSGMIADRFGVGFYLLYTLGSYIIGATLLVLFPLPETGTMMILVFLALSYPSSSNYPATITTFGFGTKEYTKINASFQTMVYLSKATLPVVILNLGKLGFGLRQMYMLQIGLAVIALTLFLSGLALLRKSEAK